jgi:glycosyltransferase involved in cell wall biosynthesis
MTERSLEPDALSTEAREGAVTRRRWLSHPRRVVAPSELPSQPSVPRIKVLHVITKFSTGAGGNTLLTAAKMDANRYEMWVAACTQGPPWERPLWDRAEQAGVRTYRLPRLQERLSPANDLVVLLQLIRLIRRERFTIVHTHTAKAGFLGRIAARLCGTPVVVHTFHSFPFHDFMSGSRRSFYLFLERRVRRLTHTFLAVSPAIAREAVVRKLAPPGGVSVAPSAIELDSITGQSDSDVRRDLGIPPNVPLVGTVGRIDFQKAPLDFVRMAALVAARRPATRFVMVGDGPLMDDVVSEARHLGVEVMLTGFREGAERLAAGFDVFVISSLYEGLGRALTEAVASGCPVVATAVNGVPDLVVPGATGLLAFPGNPESLATNVLWLLDHPVEARQMARQGRDLVSKTFAAETMCRLIDETYCRLLGLPVPEEPAPSERVIDLSDGVSHAPLRQPSSS